MPRPNDEMLICPERVSVKGTRDQLQAVRTLNRVNPADYRSRLSWVNKRGSVPERSSLRDPGRFNLLTELPFGFEGFDIFGYSRRSRSLPRRYSISH